MDSDARRELALRRLFLGRLARLTVKETVVRTPEERKLVEWAIYSTCCDCYDLGMGEDVQRILAVRQPRRGGTGDRLGT